MIKLIAETAWHHEGDFSFMKDLLMQLCSKSSADYIKLHITLDIDEYMAKDHSAYQTLTDWMFSDKQWEELIGIVQSSDKKLMLLLNDTKSIKFAARFKPEIIELHSVCLNVPHLQNAIIKYIDKDVPVVVGVGGCSLQEVDAAVRAFDGREIVLMFGFQNYPTKYEDVNLSKIRKVQSLYLDKSFGYADHTAWDETNNELITLLVAANGMQYIEKHVTTLYGEERCDYSAAISIEMFNLLAEKIDVLAQVYGDGALSLNAGEALYSQYGPMKMAATARENMDVGSILTEVDLQFLRTNEKTNLSQVEALNLVGKALIKHIGKGEVFSLSHFGEE